MIGLRQPSRTISVFILILMILILLYACSTSSVHTVPNASRRQISCDSIYNGEIFSECLERAKIGDALAAFNIAKIYDERFPLTGISGITKDRNTAFYWYKVAADSGYDEALRVVFDSYYFGHYGSENKIEAERYLEQAAKLGRQWAMLLSAHWSEKKEPEKAIGLYLELALKDNCHAQRKLAKIYFEGKLIPQDLCKSYFWALLASAGGIFRKSDYHFLAKDDYSSSGSCPPLVAEKYAVEEKLDQKYVQMVQDAASRWQKGQEEPDFPKIQIVGKAKANIRKTRPSDSLKLSKATSEEKPLKWSPAQIDLSRQLSSNLTPSELFDLVNLSVWTVIAASSTTNLNERKNIALASAVAISENKLLTNYHVIDGKPYVLVKHGSRFVKATIISGDRQTDRCILYVQNIALKPVKGFRKYNNLTIGETVYTVGSPKGLENSLGQGIVSGKRELRELKLIQTTAQISKGSSGGGLFDRFGNLIGITTFKMADSEGLNFAIAIDNFTR